jgi:O-antigen ligase
MHVVRFILTFALLLVGSVALVVPRGYSVGFFITCILGVLLWLHEREPLIDTRTKWLLWPCVAYALVNIVIGLLHMWAWRSLDPYVPFLLLPFGVWAVRRCKPAAVYFWVGLAIGAIGAAVLAGYQAVVLGLRADGGHNHAIQFGNAALLMGVLCLVRLMTVRDSKWLSILMAVGFCAGLAASVWSQTRGGWLAVILIFMWMFFTATQGWHIAKRFATGLALLCALAIPALQPNGIVQNRVLTALNEAQSYVQSGAQATSVGARLAMWQFAVKDIADAPLVGQGAQGWLRNRDKAIEDKQLDPFIKNFNQLHNEYLDVAYKTGVLGLLTLLILYVVPMLWFFKPYLHGYSANGKALAMSGMVLPMMYMDFGLTQAFLTHNSGRMVFVSLLMCLGALVLNAIEDESQSTL